MALKGFDQEYYLEAKLAALQAAYPEWAGKTADDLEATLQNVYGLTAEEHYQQYGYQEGLAPNAYFDADEYTFAKATQLFNANKYLSIQEAQAAFEAAWTGNVYDHYLQFGAYENVNPSNAFDESEYYASKLAALQVNEATAEEWAGKTVEDLQAVFQEAGLTALTHFIAYGEDEGIPVTEVPEDERPSYEESVPGETFVLTEGQDDITGTSGDDTIRGVHDDSGSDLVRTLTLGDQIDGAAGTDTLEISVYDDELDLNVATISNVENLVINNAYDDFDTLNIANNAFEEVTIDYGGTYNDDDLYIDNIKGTTDLVIEDVSTYSYTFYRNYDELYDATEGSVSFSNTLLNFDTEPEDSYAYFESYNYFSQATEVNHTFTMDTLNGRDEGLYVYEYFDTTAKNAEINSTINIIDADTPDSYAEFYFYVYNEADVADADVATVVVNIENSDGVDFWYDSYDNGESSASDVITYNLNGLENSSDDNYLGSAGFETININVAAGTEAEVYGLYDDYTIAGDQAINIVAEGDFSISDYTDFAGTVDDVTVTVSGAGNVDLGDTELGDGDADDVVTVDASALTGDFSIYDENGYAATITTGIGNDSVKVAGFGTAVTTGDGDDVVDINGYDYGDGDAETIDGGDGTDTIVINDGALLDAAAAANISNFETLDFSGGTGVYDLSVEEGLVDISASGSIVAPVSITEFAEGNFLTLTQFNDADAITVTLADDDAADELTVNIASQDTDTDEVVEGESSAVLVAAEFETINIASTATTLSEDQDDDGVALTPADYNNTVDLDAAAMTHLVITGDAMTTVTFTGAADLTQVVATGNAAGVNIDASAGAIAAGVTFNGSDAADTYTATANGDTIQANGGADSIVLDAINVAEDTVRFVSATDSQLTLIDTDDPADDEADVASGYDEITAFTSGNDVIELSSALGLATGDARSAIIQKGSFVNADFAADLEDFIGDGVDFFDTGLVDRAVAFAEDGADGYVFVDANSDGDFTQADDMFIQLTGVTALTVADLTFG